MLVPGPTSARRWPTDPATREIVERFLARLSGRASQPHRHQRARAEYQLAAGASTTTASARALDQALGDRDKLFLRYGLTSQSVEAFQLVAGQNPDTDIKSHRARSPGTALDALDDHRFFRGLRPRANLAACPRKTPSAPYVSDRQASPLWDPPAPSPSTARSIPFRYGARAAARRADATLWQRRLRAAAAAVERRRERRPPRLFLVRQRLRPRRDHEPAPGHADPAHRFDRRRATAAYRNWDLQFFAGDSWHVGSRLTLQLGLRLSPRDRAVRGQRPRQDRLTTATATISRRNSALPTACSDRWGVLRGAYGLQYGQIFPVTYQQVRSGAAGQSENRRARRPTWSTRSATYDPNDPNILRDNLRRSTRHLATPYSHQYNFSWELELGPRLEPAARLRRQPLAEAAADVVHQPRPPGGRHRANHRRRSTSAAT